MYHFKNKMAREVTIPWVTTQVLLYYYYFFVRPLCDKDDGH